MNNEMMRGEIRWCLEENSVGLGGKNRPAVIIREDRETATVVYLSSSDRNLNEPERVLVKEALEPSVALCEKITTLVKSKIGNIPIGVCSDKTLEQIVESVRKAIGGKTEEENYKDKYLEIKKQAELYAWMLEQLKDRK